MLKLSEPLKFTENLKKVEILNGKKTSTLDFTHNKECYQIGFGVDEQKRMGVLKHIEVQTTSFKKCQVAFREHFSWVCIKPKAGFGTACFGDSGGPSVCRDKKGSWVLFGALSGGSGSSPTCVPTQPGDSWHIASVNVGLYYDWIKMVMKKY